MFEVVKEIEGNFEILFNGKFSECQEFVKENNLVLDWNLFIR